MTNGLRERFPMIRNREEVISEIESKKELLDVYSAWDEEQQRIFLDYCTGVRGIKLLYDQFFKAVINPDVTPEQLEELLFLILKTKVKIVKVLPSDSSRIACYSADLLLRRYKRVKGKKGKKFSYRDIQKVYTIIFFEKSTKEFHEFPDIYIHTQRACRNTGSLSGSGRTASVKVYPSGHPVIHAFGWRASHDKV